MDMSRIALIQGHPDASTPHLCHALEHAYAEAAIAAGHEVRQVHVAQIDFPMLRSQAEWERGTLPASLQPAQDLIAWSNHVVIFFPLWLGDMPALLKAFLEQVARPGFAFRGTRTNPFEVKALAGRSARVVVTMGMPALIYKWLYRAHSVRSLERNVLGFVGFSPVNETLVGSVGQLTDAHREQWMHRMRTLGAQAE